MSKEINNREYRQKVIQDLIAQLHEGKTVDEVKQQFAEAFEGVSAAEISEAEQGLISEGLPVEEVQRLCDVHASIFKDSIQEVQEQQDFSRIPGHPAQVVKLENRAIEELLEQKIGPHLQTFAKSQDKSAIHALREDFTLLSQLDLHYIKKENLLFPYMEKYGITAPPKVMWGVDDEIRAQIKECIRSLENYEGNLSQLKEAIESAVHRIREMIFKEENILLPMLLETLTLEEWKSISNEMKDLGYCLIDKVPDWNPGQQTATETEAASAALSGNILLPTGVFSINELEGILNTLPIDITFVDKDDVVKYFSQGAERVFPRTKAIIGRKVVNCHPPASVHIVEGIVADLKSGKKDHEDFWIKMGEKYVYIRYFAVRDQKGEYLGTLEVTQNIAPIQEITGEKRLVSD